MIADGTIVDADVSATAAIATSKINGLDTALTAKAPLASPTFTGTPAAPTAAVDTNTTQLATTAYVVGQGYAKSASPTLTGTPLAPTAAANTNTTQIATTAFVATAISGFSALPSQTGNTGKYLTTDGTSASWAAVSSGATDPVPFFLMGA
jgi:hypothetical protein